MEQTNQPFEEADILAVYSDFLSSSKSAGVRTDAKGEARGRGREGENLAPQLLMLYYVLLYQDTLQSVSKSPGARTVQLLVINQFVDDVLRAAVPGHTAECVKVPRCADCAVVGDKSVC